MIKKSLLLSFLILLGGVISVWGKVIYPTQMHNFRTNGSTPTGWNGKSGTVDWGIPITDRTGESNNTFEINNSARIWAIEQFVIPNIARVKSIKITQKRSSTKTTDIWLFPYDYPTSNTWKDDETEGSCGNKYVENVKTVLGVYPGNTISNSPLVSNNDGSEVTLTVSDITSAFSDSKFTSDGALTVNMLLTSHGDRNDLYTQNESNGANRPYLTVEYYVYDVTNDVDYETLSAAVSARSKFVADAATDANTELQLFDDVALSGRITYGDQNGKTLTITPMVDLTITQSSYNNMWFLINNKGTGNSSAGTAGTLYIGSASHTITFDGSIIDTYTASVVKNENNGNITLTNVEFKNINLNSSKQLCELGSNGAFRLTNITITNCTNPGTAYIYNGQGYNDLVRLMGYFNIDNNSTSTAIYTKKRIKLGDSDSNYDGFSASNVIKIQWDGSSDDSAIGKPVIIKTQSAYLNLFELTNNDKGLFRNAGNGDICITQAYTLDMNAYGASTLVLPFASKIPVGASCYTLNYTAGNSSVKATEVKTTLPANTPVLVNAAEGSYKFVSTATSGDAATGSDAVTVGALTGVYATTDVPDGSYILWANGENPIGFYKSNNSTVAPYRAYLTADGAGARMSIVFGGNEETGVNAVHGEGLVVNGYYNLAGQRVSNPSKGLYIVNGKKTLVK